MINWISVKNQCTSEQSFCISSIFVLTVEPCPNFVSLCCPENEKRYRSAELLCKEKREREGNKWNKKGVCVWGTPQSSPPYPPPKLLYRHARISAITQEYKTQVVDQVSGFVAFCVSVLFVCVLPCWGLLAGWCWCFLGLLVAGGSAPAACCVSLCWVTAFHQQIWVDCTYSVFWG